MAHGGQERAFWARSPAPRVPGPRPSCARTPRVGEARLEDPLAGYVPSGMTVPQFDEHEITLLDLATHTSGVPLWPGNIEGAPDPPNKYAGCSLAKPYADLPTHTLARAPGSQFHFSNLGVALLGQGLAFKAREPFSELLRSRVTGPLRGADWNLDPRPTAEARPFPRAGRNGRRRKHLYSLTVGAGSVCAHAALLASPSAPRPLRSLS